MYLYKTTTFPHQALRSVSKVAVLHRFYCTSYQSDLPWRWINCHVRKKNFISLLADRKFAAILLLDTCMVIMQIYFYFLFAWSWMLVGSGEKMVREKSSECHSHKPQPFLDTKRKRKLTNKCKSNKRTKSTKISSLFPKWGNCNAQRTEKCKNKKKKHQANLKAIRLIEQTAKQQRVRLTPGLLP